MQAARRGKVRRDKARRAEWRTGLRQINQCRSSETDGPTEAMDEDDGSTAMDEDDGPTEENAPHTIFREQIGSWLGFFFLWDKMARGFWVF